MKLLPRRCGPWLTCQEPKARARPPRREEEGLNVYFQGFSGEHGLGGSI